MNLLFLLLFCVYVAAAVLENRGKGEAAGSTHAETPFPVMLSFLLFCYVLFSGVAALRQAASNTMFVLLLGFLLVLGAGYWMLARTAARQMAEQTAMAGVGSGMLARLSKNLQAWLLFLAGYAAFEQGIFDRGLFSLPHLLGGLLIGHLLFAGAMILTSAAWRGALEYLAHVPSLARFAGREPAKLFGCVDIAISEELIYRVAAQSIIISLTGWPLASVLLVAVAFSVVHEHFLRKAPMQSVEFLLFSIVLGLLFLWTASLPLVVAIHALRNFAIAWLEADEASEAGDGARDLPEPMLTKGYGAQI